MRRFFNYLRQLFCWHNFSEPEEANAKWSGEFSTRQGTKVYRYCKKCNYYTSHWKF